MTQYLKFIPLLFTKKKKWLALVCTLAGSYQLFSPNGIGANFGIPSYDTFYQEPRDVLVKRVESARDEQVETAEEFKTALER